MFARVSQVSREVEDFLIRGINGAKIESTRAPKNNLSCRIQWRKFGFGVSLSAKRVMASGQG